MRTYKITHLSHQVAITAVVVAVVGDAITVGLARYGGGGTRQTNAECESKEHNIEIKDNFFNNEPVAELVTARYLPVSWIWLGG